jgi:peptide/nickel transport system permease protein
MSDLNGNNRKDSFLRELFTTKPLAGSGLIILIIFVVVAIFADWLAPYPMENGQLPVDIIDKLKGPSSGHPLGTDGLGRDILSYLIYGARTSVILCLVCTAISTVVSLVIGVSSAVIGGKFDLILQRFIDAWMCIPGLLILLIIMSLLGNGMWQMIIAISIPGGIGGSRMIRSAAISVKDSGYVKTSQLLGASAFWKMRKHVTPNILPIVIIGLAGSLGGIVLMEATMNFLGFGVDPGTPSWGYMITNQGRTYMFKASMLAIYPGILISLMVFASAMFGDGVRDILDPRLKGGVGNYGVKNVLFGKGGRRENEKKEE